MAIAPDVALEALAQKRRAELDQALGIIPELQAQAAKHSDKQERLVELLTSREAERLLFESLHATVREEVVTLVRLPILISQLDEAADVDQATQRKAQQRGVRYRSVVDADYLDAPGAVARVRAESEAGEEIRVVPNLPLKLVIADRRIAFIPLGLDSTYSPSLVVRATALVDALYALFELLRATASPVHFTDGALQVAPAPLQAEADMTELLALLAAGLNDTHICHAPAISPSTLQRRTAAVMKRRGARSRFQRGWQAARKGGKSWSLAGIGSLPSLAGGEVPLLAVNDLTGFSHAANWSQGFLDQRMELADTQKRLPDLSPVHEIHSRKVFFLRRHFCADTWCSSCFDSGRRA